MDRKVLIKALNVSFLVGSILLLINQYDALFGDSPIRWVSAVLTYCVPFVVFLAGHFSGDEK